MGFCRISLMSIVIFRQLNYAGSNKELFVMFIDCVVSLVNCWITSIPDGILLGTNCFTKANLL